MNNFDQEIPKYRKNTGSNISKVKKKSKHKHQYEECIIINFLSWERIILLYNYLATVLFAAR